jgi:SnoaL-like protein
VPSRKSASRDRSRAAEDAEAVVARLIAVLSGDRPIGEVGACLDPHVVIHVDDAETHRGIGLWKRWVHLMRERGRLEDLRFVPVAVDVAGDVVDVTFRWSGELRRGRPSGREPTVNRVRYRVKGACIGEIWTHKANYVDIFGRWIAVTACYRLFLLWGLLYFLVRRDPAFRLDP